MVNIVYISGYPSLCSSSNNNNNNSKYTKSSSKRKTRHCLSLLACQQYLLPRVNKLYTKRVQVTAPKNTNKDREEVR